MNRREQDLVPFEASLYRAERLMVLAPHPDDDVIGCGGLIALHRAEKRQVRVIVATDGSAASAEQSPLQREEESRRALEALGGAELRFLGFIDRQLSDRFNDLKAGLRREIVEFVPDAIALPCPVDLHPDHVTMSHALITLVAEDDELTGRMAMTRILFYEAGQPIRPNLLFDITPVAEKKYEAIRAHESQIAIRDYEWFARGMNQYRTLTLEGSSKYAEAYYAIAAVELRTRSISELAQLMSPAVAPITTSARLEISVIVRTKNRLPWLREAIDSIRANAYPASIVVVNDGGQSPAEICQSVPSVHLVNLEEGVGRSEAMNAGVRSTNAEWIAFLDDDDLFHAEHLGTLAASASSSPAAGYYTDAVSSFWIPSAEGSYRLRDKMRLYAQDFDRSLLLVDNYIPLTTLLVRRSDYLDVGGFSSDFDLFEDWDFLIRLTAKGSLLRIPRVTCEVRHFDGADSALQARPEGSKAFRDAKLKVWAKHSTELTHDLLADVFERRKSRMLQTAGELLIERGRASHLELDVTRLQRERDKLLAELQMTARLKGDVEGRLETEIEHLRALEANVVELLSIQAGMARAIEGLESDRDQRDETIHSLYGEIGRLNGLLEMIYNSRTWKLHRAVERIKGNVG